MPKGQKRESVLPAKLSTTTVDAEQLVSLKAAARLAHVHPTVLEMADRLVKRPDGEGARLALDTSMRKHANDIEAEIVRGLRRCAKGYDRQDLNVRSYMGDGFIVFWYEVKAARAKRQGATSA